MKMEIVVRQFMKAHPKTKSYSLDAVLCASGEYKATDPVCKGNRGKSTI